MNTTKTISTKKAMLAARFNRISENRDPYEYRNQFENREEGFEYHLQVLEEDEDLVLSILTDWSEEDPENEELRKLVRDAQNLIDDPDRGFCFGNYEYTVVLSEDGNMEFVMKWNEYIPADVKVIDFCFGRPEDPEEYSGIMEYVADAIAKDIGEYRD